MPKNTVFVDTSAWYALADKSDRYNSQAVKVYPQLFKRSHHLTTTNLVISESYILMRRAIGHQSAVGFLKSLGASPRITKIYSDSVLEDVAEDILQKYHDQDFSYTDAVSFAVMEQYGITQAFTFDHHFLTAGYEIIP